MTTKIAMLLALLSMLPGCAVHTYSTPVVYHRLVYVPPPPVYYVPPPSVYLVPPRPMYVVPGPYHHPRCWRCY